jgi:hypothetical protein
MSQNTTFDSYDLSRVAYSFVEATRYVEVRNRAPRT